VLYSGRLLALHTNIGLSYRGVARDNSCSLPVLGGISEKQKRFYNICPRRKYDGTDENQFVETLEFNPVTIQ